MRGIDPTPGCRESSMQGKYLLIVICSLIPLKTGHKPTQQAEGNALAVQVQKFDPANGLGRFEDNPSRKKPPRIEKNLE
jgi:hypothetical protein